MEKRKILTLLAILSLTGMALLVHGASAQEPKVSYGQQMFTRLNIGSVNMLTGFGKVAVEVRKFTGPVSGSEGITNFQHLLGGLLSGTAEAAETVSIGALDALLFFVPSEPISGPEYWFKGVKWSQEPQGQQFNLRYMMDKLNVGSVNVITGMGKFGTEILRQTKAEGHDPVTGFLGGLISGTTQAIKTTALGALDLSLFFMPTVPVSGSQYWWLSSEK